MCTYVCNCTSKVQIHSSNISCLLHGIALNSTNVSCRGSRPSWELVGAGCSNQMQVAQGQVLLGSKYFKIFRPSELILQNFTEIFRYSLPLYPCSTRVRHAKREGSCYISESDFLVSSMVSTDPRIRLPSQLCSYGREYRI